MDKKMSKDLNIKFEKAIRLLEENLPITDETSRKPILPHDIRVGVYLFEKGYSEELVLAGVLHDALEWSKITEKMLRDEFGEKVTKLVLANTKDDSITDKQEKIEELIQRCVKNGQEALIVKTADIIDSFQWYSSQNNKDELQYCLKNANAILKYKLDVFDDKIFDELKSWQSKSSN